MKKVFSIILAVIIITMTVVPAAAASNSFVPSIEAKASPKIIMQTDSKGVNVAAIIYDKDGHEIAGVPESAVIITPLAAAEEAENAIKEALNYAYTQIKDADDLSSLTSEVTDYLKQHYPEMSLDDLVVSQIFDIRLSDEYADYLVDGAYFSVSLDFGESFLFFLLLQGGNWSIGKDYKIDGNVVTLNLAGSTQIALIKSNYSPAVTNKNNAEITSPQTGDYTNVLLITLGTLFAIGAALLIVMFVKNKENASK